MSKVVMPPQINSLDELLELMVHPDKGMAYLKQLQTVRDGITASLAAYATKEAADEYLAQAREKESKAQEAFDRAVAKSQESQQIVQACSEQLKNDQESWAKAKALDQAGIDASKREVIVKAESLKQAELDLAKREVQLKSDQASLIVRRQKLDEETARMNKRKELLNAI